MAPDRYTIGRHVQGPRTRQQFALKSVIIGGCLGVGVALVFDGPLLAQVVVGGLVTAIVTGGCWWALTTLATALIDSRSDSRSVAADRELGGENRSRSNTPAHSNTR